MIDGKNFFDQPVKSDMRTYDNEKLQQVKKMITELVVYHFNKHYKLIAIDLSKQQALDADPKTVQQINITGNVDREAGATMFFIIEISKETILVFSQ